MKPVTLYTTRTCMYCAQAKKLLAEHGVVAPVEFQVDVDGEKRTEMIERTGQYTVPQIFIGETHVGGYDALKALHTQKTLSTLLGEHTDGVTP